MEVISREQQIISLSQEPITGNLLLLIRAVVGSTPFLDAVWPMRLASHQLDVLNSGTRILANTGLKTATGRANTLAIPDSLLHFLIITNDEVISVRQIKRHCYAIQYKKEETCPRWPPSVCK